MDRPLEVDVAAIRAATSGPANYPFVTISRQTGAGGHSVAMALLEVFARQPEVDLFRGWHVFDQRLCEVVAADPKLAGSLESLLTEEYRSRMEDFLHHLLTPSIGQDFVLDRVFRAVRTLAGLGKTIIVGRGGAQVTEGMDRGVSLRLVAPEHVRLERIMASLGVDQPEARRQARRLDTHRARLVKRHFRTDIDDPLAYDAVWNTGAVEFGDIAEAVTAVLRRRMQDPAG